MLRRQRLEPAIAVGHRVAHERNLALDVDALRGEPVVIGRIAAASVDEWSGHLARRRVRVMRNAHIGASRRGIAVNRIFLQRERLRDRRSQSHRDFFRIGQQHFVLDDLDLVEAVASPFVPHPFGQFAIAWRTGDVRLARQEGMGISHAFSRGEGEKASLQRRLATRRVRREPEDLDTCGRRGILTGDKETG